MILVIANVWCMKVITYLVEYILSITDGTAASMEWKLRDVWRFKEYTEGSGIY
jgi:hypothetical protein